MFIFEDYVGFETAKLLKENGFDWIVERCFLEHKNYYVPCDPSEIQRKDAIAIPTIQMAMKWLRREHNLAISTSVTVDGWHSYVSRIKLDSEGFVVDIIDGIDGGNIPNRDTYEDSCEVAIKYCLENLI